MAPGETASMDERTDAWEKRMPSWLQKEEEAQATSCTFSRTMARDWRGSVETAKVAASAAMASASKAPDGAREHGENRPNSRYVGHRKISARGFH